MIRLLSNVISRELSHWHALSQAAKSFFFSICAYELAGPMLHTFTYAFIYRSTSNIEDTSLMNLGWYLSIPFVFYWNGFLLRHFSIRRLYSFGLITIGLVNALIFFIPINKITLFVLGIIFGIPMGLYWANRNYLTLSTTNDSNRNYFKSLETAFPTLVSLVLPPIIGLSIAKAETLTTLSSTQIYQIWMIVSLLCMVLGVWGITKMPAHNPKPKIHLLAHASTTWKRMRFVRAIQGFADGVLIFLPTLIILALLGDESVLGNSRALMALGSVVVLYWFGTRGSVAHRLRSVQVAYWLFALLSAAFALLFNKMGVILYLLGLTIFGTFTWTALETIVMKIIDDEEDGDMTNNFAYIVDQEGFLNIGRVLGVICMISLSALASSTNMVRSLPVVLAASQLVLVQFVKKGIQEKSKIPQAKHAL